MFVLIREYGVACCDRYLEELQAAATTGRLELQVEPDIERMVVKRDGDGRDDASNTDHTLLIVDDEVFGLVILATGVALDPSSSPIFKEIRKNFPATFVGGFPQLDESLRWSENEDIFVVGCNAGLQLGPGALNLMGAMRSGILVAEELHDLMWKDTRAHKSQLESNLYGMLEIDSCSSSESDDDDHDDFASCVK